MSQHLSSPQPAGVGRNVLEFEGGSSGAGAGFNAAPAAAPRSPRPPREFDANPTWPSGAGSSYPAGGRGHGGVFGTGTGGAGGGGDLSVYTTSLNTTPSTQSREYPPYQPAGAQVPHTYSTPTTPSPHVFPSNSSSSSSSELPSDQYHQPILPRHSQENHHSQRVGQYSGSDRSPTVSRTAPSSPYHRQPYSATTAPQDQLERLAAEAQSVLSGTPFTPQRYDTSSAGNHSPHPNNTPSRSSSSSTTASSRGVYSPQSRERSSIADRERDRIQQAPLTVVPESPSWPPPKPQPSPLMSSTNANPGKAIPRSSSIDSAISSVSAQSGMSHSHSQSSASNNLLSNVTGTSTADVQSLIQAAGSAEELVRYMLKDKQSLTAQNSQLWRLVDKQRGMILGLNKDLERALREKDRYRTKFKERMAVAPPNLGGAGVAPGRSTSESPAPSLDDSRTIDRGPGSPTDMTPIDNMSIDMELRSPPSRAALPPTPSPSDVPVTNEEAASSSTRSEAVSPHDRLRNGSFSESDNEHNRMSPAQYQSDKDDTPRQQPMRTIPVEEEMQERRAPSTKTTPNLTLLPGDFPRPADDIDTATPISAGVQVHSPQLEFASMSEIIMPPKPKPMNQARKLGISTAVAPVSGLGKSPVRKGPPAPLALNTQQRESDGKQRMREQHDDDDDGDDDDDEDPSDIRSTLVTAGSANSWQMTPEDKKAMTPAPIPARSELPPSRAAPIPEIQQPIPPTPSFEQAVSPRIRQQFAKAPLPSPGLPSSPRPIDRPMNSPQPRNSRIIESMGLPGSPKPPFVGSPRMSMPANSSFGALPSPRPPFAHTIHERSGSAGSMSSLTNFKSVSPMTVNQPKILLLQPSAIPSVDARVVSSRMRPSRQSVLPGKGKNVDDPCFTLGVFSRADSKELVRVEKDANSLVSLDSKLRKCITFSVKLPDKSMFSGYAPARVDARRTAIDQYFSGVLGATMDERAALQLCEFFSTDVVETSSSPDGERNSPKSFEKSTAGKGKEGFLTKKGKNFGGWKERYFVLDGPVLKYFDRPEGTHLGQIKLQNAQIGRQSAQKNKDDSGGDEESQYRHAFLVLEPKRKDTSTLVRHVLCAESDAERDEWVAALMEYVKADEEATAAATKQAQLKKARPGSKKEGKEKDGKELSDEARAAEESALRALSYEETNPGPAPARGPTPEDLQRQRISPSPSAMLGQPTSQNFAANSPVPDRGNPGKQISGPSGGSVISDLAAWGASKLTDKPTDKAMKKRSIWGFRQRSSSDLSGQALQHGLTGQQAAAERFPLPRHVFGATLEEAVYLTKPPGMEIYLPAVVYRCIEYLDAKNASEEEGIFRLSGSNVVIKGLKDRFNSESDLNLLASDEYYDVHAIASLLKLYLRELPMNILTSERRDDFVQVTEMKEKSAKITALNHLVHTLPIENFSLLKALSGHLLRIVDNADINKMTIRNIGIVFSPTLNIPAQVFSMFLHEYRQIFFSEGETPQSPQPLAQPTVPSQRIIEPPGTPTFTPLQQRPQQRQQQPAPYESYEPSYERREPTSPTSSIGTNLSQATNNTTPSSLGVPSDGKSAKSRRRESSMMFMMGGMGKNKGSGNTFDKSAASKNAMVQEDSVYE